MNELEYLNEQFDIICWNMDSLGMEHERPQMYRSSTQDLLELAEAMKPFSEFGYRRIKDVALVYKLVME